VSEKQFSNNFDISPTFLLGIKVSLANQR